MPAIDRRYAVQGKHDLEAERLHWMLTHMPSNKAYRYAVQRTPPSGDSSLLEEFRRRYTAYRKGWRDNPRQAIEAGVGGTSPPSMHASPMSVDIEVASACDLACPFCFRQSIATPDKLMRPDLYYRIIDQCAALGVPSIKLNWRGESLLHPKLPAFIDYAKQRGILETILNTDAVTLTDEKSRAVIDAGLDLMIYSFDGGTKETYETMRPGRFHHNRFDDVYANIRRFSEIRHAMHSPFPRTHIQMVLTDETYQEQDQFFDLFEHCVDSVTVKAYTERGGALEDLDAESREQVSSFLQRQGLPATTPYWRDRQGQVMVSAARLPCEQIFQRLMVTYNGSVSMCCYDWGNEFPIGSVDPQAYQEGMTPYLTTIDKAQRNLRGFEGMGQVTLPTRLTDVEPRVHTLAEIWNGTILNGVRRHHLAGRVDEVKICRSCPFKETYHWIPVSDIHHRTSQTPSRVPMHPPPQIASPAGK